MCSKRENIEVMTYDNPDENIEEILDLLLSRYQIIFWFSGLDKKATINPKNDNEKYFQYVTKFAFNHEKI